jgi:hypothetical protein
MRVATHELLANPEHHVVGAETVRRARQLRQEHDLQQQIPELFAQRRALAAVDRVHDFAGLFQHVAPQGGGRLFTIPGAAIGSQQPLHQLHQTG